MSGADGTGDGEAEQPKAPEGRAAQGASQQLDPTEKTEAKAEVPPRDPIKVGGWTRGQRRLARDFGFGLLGAIVSGIILWQIQVTFSDREAARASGAKLAAIKVSVASECDRLSRAFAAFYNGYPTVECGMNVYRAPRPDSALVDYLKMEREFLVERFGDAGAALVRNAAGSLAGYDSLFDGPYFKAVVSRETTTWQHYFSPLREMCLWSDIKIEIQTCPF
ncbi:MAG: hypothetical protein Q8Q62_14380 [Mesorhizobium sp.]|nr:hypothetical protein [Mesorhizobium sp.]